MDSRARDVLKIGDGMFSAKGQVDILNQEIALNFYPERADFTTERNVGDEYSDHLFSSLPVMARRELANVFSSHLRPRDNKWFSIHVADERLDKGDAERAWLEWLRDIQWTAMYEQPTGFVRATKQGDHDFAAFGSCVIKVSPNVNRDGLLFVNYHLRDNVWSENAEGIIDHNHRNWTPTARQLKHHFPDTISADVRKACEREPEKTFPCRHVVMPGRLYDYRSPGGRRFPFVSLIVERKSETVLEEVGLNYFPYVIPRWQTVDGSPFGCSMATSVALPDGRTMQAVMRTLREAGEKFVDPPMIQVADAIRGDIALYAGGITTADIEYDERLGEVLRPLYQDKSGMPIGFEIAAALKEDIRNGFFLDIIQLPETSGEKMTAFEVRQRIDERLKAQSPLFEPIAEDYNTQLCEKAFQVLRDGGAFPLGDMPDSLQGSDVRFQFRTPLADLAEMQEAQIWIDGLTRVLLPAAEVDEAQLEQVDLTRSTRAALRAIGFRQDWLKPEEAVEKRRAEIQREQAMAKGMQTLAAAGQVAEQGGKGIDAMNGAGGGSA